MWLYVGFSLWVHVCVWSAACVCVHTSVCVSGACAASVLEQLGVLPRGEHLCTKLGACMCVTECARAHMLVSQHMTVCTWCAFCIKSQCPRSQPCPVSRDRVECAEKL